MGKVIGSRPSRFVTSVYSDDFGATLSTAMESGLVSPFRVPGVLWPPGDCNDVFFGETQCRA